MSLQKEAITFGLFVALLCCIPTSVEARSVYAIPKHEGSILNVYDVLEGAEEGQLEYRAGYNLKYDGAADVTIDTRSNMLFVTSEFLNEIELVNARTFLSEGEVTAEEASDLAGVLIHQVDPNTTRLYTVDRGTNKLFMYDWDAGAKELTLLPYSPTQDWYTLLPYIPEDNPVFACGLALDGADGTLYVSQLKRIGPDTFTYSNIVYAYDPNVSAPEPDDLFRCTRKIDLGQYEGEDNNAVDIDVDSANGWLYAGGFQSHKNLIRYDLRDEAGSPGDDGHVQPICKGVIGLAVSQQSHDVYMTTFNQKLEAWDTETWEQFDAEPTVRSGGGAGVCVSEVGYTSPFAINKVDDVDDCASPRGGQITYNISFDYQWADVGYTDPNIIDSIEVVDYLPAEFDLVSAQPDTGFYYDPNHSYTWTLTDSSSFGDTHYFELVVQAQNARLTPGGMIENNVKLSATINEGVHIDRFTLETPICDCNGYTDVIYVDADATPGGNGQTWPTAYKYLQDALSAALPCDQIWVADGTYKPVEGTDPNLTFQLVNGVGMYGGFEGTEEERYERDWADPCKEAILSGNIEGDEDSYYVVKNASDVEVGCLDGFTITGGTIAGVYCKEGSPIIQHNKIMSSSVGIYCENTDQPVIKNNWIYRNDYGMYFDNPGDTTMVRNNTVVYNDEVGIAFEPGTTTVNGCLVFETGAKPMITNCIFAGHPEDCDMVGCYATYSYIEYPIVFDPNATPPSIGQGNIHGEPNYPPFVVGVDDYHLDPCSPCIDAGDPNGDYTGERDIDKQFRVLDGSVDGKRVDIGADEYCNEGDENDADFNYDGIVDTNDLRELAAAWLIDDSDPCWYTKYDEYDLNTDKVINYGDFAYFAKEWLWIACWKMADIPIEMMMGMGGGMDKMAGGESMLISEPAAEQKASETPSEPSVSEQIEQIKYLLDWLYEVAETMDEDIWLSLTASLEEMLKDLEDSQ